MNQSKMNKRDFITKLLDGLKTDLIRDINQGIIPENTTKNELISIITNKIKNHEKN